MRYGCGEIEVRGNRFRVRAYVDGKRTETMAYQGVPGTHINAVAVGFEILEGPISGLASLDFYVDPS